MKTDPITGPSVLARAGLVVVRRVRCGRAERAVTTPTCSRQSATFLLNTKLESSHAEFSPIESWRPVWKLACIIVGVLPPTVHVSRRVALELNPRGHAA